MLELLIRYCHFLGIIALFVTLVGEHLLVTPQMDRTTLKRVGRLDAIYGIAAGIVLAAGLYLWFAGSKGAAFYSANPIFHIKVTLFVVVGLLSIYPTVFFLRSRKLPGEIIAVPRKIIVLIRAQLALLLVIPLLAVLMARGIGLSG